MYFYYYYFKIKVIMWLGFHVHIKMKIIWPDKQLKENLRKCKSLQLPPNSQNCTWKPGRSVACLNLVLWFGSAAKAWDLLRVKKCLWVFDAGKLANVLGWKCKEHRIVCLMNMYMYNVVHQILKWTLETNISWY